jgi:hypothetical protein
MRIGLSGSLAQKLLLLIGKSSRKRWTKGAKMVLSYNFAI